MPRFSRRIQPWVQLELDAANRAEARAERALVFRHLERAHVLGQATTTLRVRVPWLIDAARRPSTLSPFLE